MVGLRRPKRLRRLPLKLRDETNAKSLSPPKKFKCVRVGNSFRGLVRSPRRHRGPTKCKKVVVVSQCKYPVERILTHTVEDDGVTRFRMKWCPPDDDESMEPIETIHHLPILVQKYLLREKAKFLQRFRKSKLVSKEVVPFQFPKLKKNIEAKLKHPAESYIPIGSETVSKILEEVEVGRGVTLWLVQFLGFDTPHLVNKQRIVYYFPLKACLYVHECVIFREKNK